MTLRPEIVYLGYLKNQEISFDDQNSLISGIEGLQVDIWCQEIIYEHEVFMSKITNFITADLQEGIQETSENCVTFG